MWGLEPTADDCLELMEGESNAVMNGGTNAEFVVTVVE